MAEETKIEEVEINGVPLSVDYTLSSCGDISITEVWINGIEMMCLVDDSTISRIRDAIRRKLEP